VSNEKIDLTNADEHVVAANALLGKMYAQLVAPAGVEPADNDPTVFAWSTPSVPLPTDIFDYLEDGFIPTIRDIDVRKLAADVETAGIPPTDPEFRVAMAQAMEQERLAEVQERWRHAQEVATLCDSLPNLDVTFGENSDQILMTLSDNTGAMSTTYRQILDEIEVGERPEDPEAKERMAQIEALLYEPESNPPGAPEAGEDPDPFGSMLNDLLGDSASTSDPTTSADLPRPSKMVRIYDEMRAQYETAVAEYADRVLESQTSPEAADNFNRFGAIYRRRVEDALRAWRSVGKKNQIDALHSMLSHLTRADMVTFVENARIRYDVDDLAANQGLTPFKFTTVVPGSVMSLPWQRVTFDHTDIDRYSRHVQRNAGGRVGLNFGFWGVSGGANWSNEQIDRTLDVTGINMSFEITQVLIHRPWFTPSLFDSREWRLRGGDLLSDGAAVPSGRLRGYTDAMILVRDLSIEHRELHTFFDKETTTTGGGGGLRIGPFRLGGGGSSSKTEIDQGVERTSTSITQPGPALAGFRCRRFSGPVPNPDPGIERFI
jgi:hypothetical protein